MSSTETSALPEWLTENTTWADVEHKLTTANAATTSLAGGTTLRIPTSLAKAVAVANHYLRPSIGAIEVIDPNGEDELFSYGDGPATMEEILATTATVLAILESGEDVGATPCASRVTADGDEYYVTISEDETPEHLVDVAAFSIISAIHLKREAAEAMNRAVVALALAAK